MQTLSAEGLHAAPWFRELSRRGVLGISDCEQCKVTLPKAQRQALGCGYEPKPDGKVHLSVWQPPSGKHGYQGPELTTCAGYTANLPEVIEASLNRAHWAKGNASVLGPLSKEALKAILVVDGETNQLQAWLLTPAAEGGGGS